MSTQLVPMHSPQGDESSNKAAFPPNRYLCFGTFHLDLHKEELFKDGTRVKLQGKVYQALFALLQKPGEIVTREELRMHLWPLDTHVNYDANVNTTVNKLRQVLGDSSDQPAFVDTIPRKGYSFVATCKVPTNRYSSGAAIAAACRTSACRLRSGSAEHAESKASFAPRSRPGGSLPGGLAHCRQHVVWCGPGVVRAPLTLACISQQYRIKVKNHL
jgi:DNA-binding winged helix-turn-helix (wHTH) protein